MCPLCGDQAALTFADQLDVRVTCAPCGGNFAIAHGALMKWQRLDRAARVLALPRARDYIAELHEFAAIPQILPYHVDAWGRTS